MTPAAALLAGEDWRPLDQYPVGEFVYVKGFYSGAPAPSVVVARNNGKPWSLWMHPPPDGMICYFYPTAWQPLPPDTDVNEAAYFLDGPPQPIFRPAEPAYEPAGVDARLTPAPAKLLRALAAGVVLQEREQVWAEWKLRHPDGTLQRLTERNITALRKVAFIERIGRRWLQRPDTWIQSDWRITDAGNAWLAANPDRPEKLKPATATAGFDFK